MGGTLVGSVDTSYGHRLEVHAHPGPDAAVEVRVGPSVDVAGPDAHLDADQAEALVGLLGAAGDLGPAPGGVAAPEATSRGFFCYATVTTVDGRRVRVQESSAATGPHVWLFTDRDAGAGTEGDPVSLRLSREEAVALRDGLAAHLALIPERWDLDG